MSRVPVIYFALILIATVAFQVDTYSSGAPASQCVSMMPLHTEESTDVLPFQTNLNRNEMLSNETADVVITSLDGKGLFKGFLLMALDDETNKAVGQFHAPTDGQSHQRLNCYDVENSAVTHTNGDFKTFMTFRWTPPQGFDGTVKFWTTYVQSISIYWVKRASATLKITASEEAPTTVATSPTPPAEIPNVSIGCGNSKGCIVLPSEDCVTQNNTCSTIVSHTKLNDSTVEIEIYSQVQSNRYVAVGFSADKKMGDDSVIECVYYNDRVHTFQSFNLPGERNQRMNPPVAGFEILSRSYVDGYVYCKVQLPTVYTVNNITYNLTKPYYVLNAFGKAADGFSITEHDDVRVSQSQIAITEETATVKMGEGDRELKQIHGALMVIAWLISGSIGVLMPRYMKKTWVGKQLYKKDMWFVYHQCLMLLTWTLTMIAFVLIFVDVGGWVSESISENPHPLIGCITTGLAFIQPIMAFFRPAPNATKRYIFNWAHAFVGYSAHILALTCIFLAVEMDEAQLPLYTYWVLSVHVVCYVTAQVTFTLLARRNASVLRELKNDELRDEPGSSVRRKLLFVYVVIMLGLGFTVVGFIGAS